MIPDISKIRPGKTGRCSSWDRSGRNADYWMVEPGETRVLADLEGPGAITHIWMTQRAGYRECLLRMTWDGADRPSVIVPLGDFFCLGHGIVNSFQSFLFTASNARGNAFDAGCALNCYARMPFAAGARIELVNEGRETQRQYFYIDYETFREPEPGAGYFHAEFRRANPFGGWGPEITVNSPEADAANRGRAAWRNNYLILEAKGRGHYIGCNLSVTNFQGTWWGEGDEMIWVDGYKWPPDIHGTGSEDYLNQAWGMQENAFLRNGSSIFEGLTMASPGLKPWTAGNGGYQTSYVLHLENPVRFRKEIRVSIEHGHANHLANEMSSTAYWYGSRPAAAVEPPPVEARLPVPRDNRGRWMPEKVRPWPGRRVTPNAEMKRLKSRWAGKNGPGKA